MFKHELEQNEILIREEKKVINEKILNEVKKIEKVRIIELKIHKKVKNLLKKSLKTQILFL
jgi:hypothetical protein